MLMEAKTVRREQDRASLGPRHAERMSMKMPKKNRHRRRSILSLPLFQVLGGFGGFQYYPRSPHKLESETSIVFMTPDIIHSLTL